VQRTKQGFCAKQAEAVAGQKNYAWIIGVALNSSVDV